VKKERRKRRGELEKGKKIVEDVRRATPTEEEHVPFVDRIGEAPKEKKKGCPRTGRG